MFYPCNYITLPTPTQYVMRTYVGVGKLCIGDYNIMLKWFHHAYVPATGVVNMVTLCIVLLNYSYMYG